MAYSLVQLNHLGVQRKQDTGSIVMRNLGGRIEKFGPAEFPPSRELPVWAISPRFDARELFCRQITIYLLARPRWFCFEGLSESFLRTVFFFFLCGPLSIDISHNDGAKRRGKALPQPEFHYSASIHRVAHTDAQCFEKWYVYLPA